MKAENRPKPPKRPSAARLAVIAGLVLVLISEITVSGFLVGRGAQRADSEYDSVTATQTAPGLTAERCVAAKPLDWLSGQVLMVGVAAAGMPAAAQLFKQYDIGGAVLMTAPADPDDGSITAFKQSAASRGVPALMATDEEGGSVQRFTALGVLPPARTVAASDTPGQAQNDIYQHGLKLKAAGIDMVLGPLADVAPQQAAGPLGDRVFSSDPLTVKSFDDAYISGWRAAGLLPTLKHFPGLGSASANTDYQPAVSPPLAELKKRDFIPYQDTAATGTAVMVGNQNVPGWFSGPASLSPAVNQYLRGVLGYKNNLIITDSLSVPGVTATTAESQAAADAVIAGNDMAMLVEPMNDPTPSDIVISQAENDIEVAVTSGKISKQQLISSVLRKLAAQHAAPCSR